MLNFIKSLIKPKSDPQIEQIYGSISSKLTNGSNYKELSDNESTFIKETLKIFKLNNQNPAYVNFQRLSDGCFNVFYKNGLYVGKIKLNGRKTYMQILPNLKDINKIENESLEVYIQHISEWVSYCRCNKL